MYHWIFLKFQESQLLVIHEQGVKIIIGRNVNSLPAVPYSRFLPKLFMLLKTAQGKQLMLLLSGCRGITSGSLLCCRVAERLGRMALKQIFLICCLVTQLILSFQLPEYSGRINFLTNIQVRVLWNLQVAEILFEIFFCSTELQLLMASCLCVSHPWYILSSYAVYFFTGSPQSHCDFSRGFRSRILGIDLHFH